MPTGIGKHEAGGRFHRDRGRDPGAERDPDDERIAQVERIHDIEIEIREVVDRGHAGRPLGMPEARMGRRDQPAAFGQHRKHGRGRVEADMGVEEQDRPAAATIDELKPRPVDDD